VLSPRPRTQTDEHERAQTGGDQARKQHDRQPCPSQTRRLDQDHRPDHRRPKDGRDRGEAAGGGDHHDQFLRRVALGSPHGQRAQTHAERNQRRLRSQQ